MAKFTTQTLVQLIGAGHPLMVEKFKAERVTQVLPSSTNRCLACLKSMFSKAILWGKFSDNNPAAKVKFFKESSGRLRFLEKEEITRLLSVCNKYLKSIIIVAINTGIRKGKILNLKWRDIDFKREVLFLYDTKNGDKREVPLNEQVKTVLIETSKHPESEYVFCKKDGTLYGDIKKPFSTALKRVKITDFKFHDLRHTFASQLVMAGVDLNTVRELLGHKSIKMTLRYAHLSPSHKKRAVDLLDNQISDRLGKNEREFVPYMSPEKENQKVESLSIPQLYEI